jgi:hypothetical protein
VNVPVLGELVFAGAHAIGNWGLLALQVGAALTALVVVVIAAKRLGARPLPSATAISLVALGALPALGVARAQALSFVPFVGLVLLLRSQYWKPDWRIWFAVPLLAAWGNLHGAVLVGIALTGAYLMTSRLIRDPATAIGVGLASVAALWATPAGLLSHEYYLTVLGSAATDRGEGLWAKISLSSPFDVLLVITGVALLSMTLRRRAPLWEWVAIVGLAAMTVQTSRHGVWLLLFLAPRAAAAIGDGPSVQGVTSIRSRGVVAMTLLLGSGLTLQGLNVRAGSVTSVLSEARDLAHSLPNEGSVLAPPVLAEALAVEGATIWAGNPLDAFPRNRQELYLDFIRDPATAQPHTAPQPVYVILQDGQPCPVALCPSSGRVLYASDGYVVHRGWTR